MLFVLNLSHENKLKAYDNQIVEGMGSGGGGGGSRVQGGEKKGKILKKKKNKK